MRPDCNGINPSARVNTFVSSGSCRPIREGKIAHRRAGGVEIEGTCESSLWRHYTLLRGGSKRAPSGDDPGARPLCRLVRVARRARLLCRRRRNLAHPLADDSGRGRRVGRAKDHPLEQGSAGGGARAASAAPDSHRARRMTSRSRRRTGGRGRSCEAHGVISTACSEGHQHGRRYGTVEGVNLFRQGEAASLQRKLSSDPEVIRAVPQRFDADPQAP